jgi:ATP phosphoribosyltransferase regulatory subunit
MPPLIEYIESLLTVSGRDLELATFKLVDQLSGRTMGLRADITPQVARIDAHLLDRAGVVRLCYAGSVLHARPAGPLSTREPLQVGAELYGHAGPEADLEVIELLLRSLREGRRGPRAHRPRPRRRGAHAPCRARRTGRGRGVPADPVEDVPGLEQALAGIPVSPRVARCSRCPRCSARRRRSSTARARGCRHCRRFDPRSTSSSGSPRRRCSPRRRAGVEVAVDLADARGYRITAA